MEAARPRTPYALLTRLFLRQFLENDLISPDADRSQLLAVVGGMVLSLTLFATVVISARYVAATLTPGQVAVLSLDDKFFFFALAITVPALVAVTQWDALAIGARDVGILEPLPVRIGTIRLAKLSAVGILGTGVAAGVNLSPSVVFPWMLVFGFRQMSSLAMLWLMVTHAIVGLAAAGFGYLSVIALRETMAAVLGPRWFRRVSPWAQGALIVTLGSSLLLLPAAADRIAQRGFDGWRAMSPPMWFLGVYETMSGGVVADLPRAWMAPPQARNDHAAATTYGERRGRFPALARRAGWAIALTVFLSAAAYLWNARRVPSLTAPALPGVKWRWRLGRRLANTVLLRSSAARAGFHFTLAAMWRSNTHRLTLACAAAAGLAMAIVAFSSSTVLGGVAPPRLLAMQPLLYGALLVGFRHVIRVPAELRANWGFQLAWRGQHGSFLAGAKCAAVAVLVLPALAVLLPVFVFVLGPQRALMHAALGLGGAIVLLEALMLSYEKVPFTCTYLPSENMKALAPVYAIAFLVGALQFARMQSEVLWGTSTIRALVTLAAVFAIVRVMAVTRRRLPHVEFDEAPATLQRLGLNT